MERVMNQPTRNILSLPGRQIAKWPWILSFYFFYISTLCQQVSFIEFYIVAGLSLAFLVIRLVAKPSSIWAFYLLCLLLSLAALWQPLFRGTHRWVHICGIFLNSSVLLSAAAILTIGQQDCSARVRLCIFSISTALLLLARAYSLTLIFLLAVALAGFFHQIGLTRKFVLLLLLICFFAPLLDSNRLRRVQDFTGSMSAYQAKQISKTIPSVRIMGPSKNQIHLPCWSTDLAFLDLARKQGLLVSFLFLIILCGALQQLYKLSRINPGAMLCATFLGLQAFFHLIVNLNLFPPMGINMPFLGKGGTSWIATLLLFNIPFVSESVARAEHSNYV
jgi:cell division protein FtsW (lipid II flippase)